MITFPECIRHLFADCLSKINEDIAKLGLSTIEVVVHEKRKGHEEGYNKVVLITNELADTVVGRVGDGIVTYPFLWEDSELGPRMLGVDGKWNCLGLTPDKCCDDIKQSMYQHLTTLAEIFSFCLVLPSHVYFQCCSYIILYFFFRTHVYLYYPRRSQPRYERQLHRVSYVCPIRWNRQSS